MEDRDLMKVDLASYIKSGMTMGLEDIKSIITLTLKETEELAMKGRLKSDEKFKKKKLTWNQ